MMPGTLTATFDKPILGITVKDDGNGRFLLEDVSPKVQEQSGLDVNYQIIGINAHG